MKMLPGESDVITSTEQADVGWGSRESYNQREEGEKLLDIK